MDAAREGENRMSISNVMSTWIAAIDGVHVAGTPHAGTRMVRLACHRLPHLVATWARDTFAEPLPVLLSDGENSALIGTGHDLSWTYGPARRTNAERLAEWVRGMLGWDPVTDRPLPRAMPALRELAQRIDRLVVCSPSASIWPTERKAWWPATLPASTRWPVTGPVQP